jgi:hypothetical protein
MVSLFDVKYTCVYAYIVASYTVLDHAYMHENKTYIYTDTHRYHMTASIHTHKYTYNTHIQTCMPAYTHTHR